MSEIRVNRVVAADGSSAPQFPAGLSLATGAGITNSPNILGAAVTFSGISKVTDSTDSTSSTTGSLIVTGGVGIAKNVFIGAGLSVAGTLTYEDVTNIDAVGVITAKSGINVTGGSITQTGGGGYSVTGGGELKVGTAVTISSTAGVSTFNADVVFDGATADRDIIFDKSRDALTFKDNAYAEFGTGTDFQIYHTGSHTYLKNGTGNLYLTAKSDEDGIIVRPDAGTELYHNNVKRIETTLEGVNVSGMVSATAGLGVTGGMWEGAFIKAGKLSDNLQIGISTSNIFVFTTAETTTATPNIRWDDTYALSSKMNIGDAVTVTIVTTAAAAGYAANITVDGNAVTEEWNGGSAPSAGGAGGYDVYTYTLIRKAAGTGDTGWITLANVSNFA